MDDFYEKPRDTYIRDSRYVDAPRDGAGGLWFIVGGVVVALGVLFVALYAPGDGSVTPVDGGTAVTIETAPPADAPAAPPAVDTAPAPTPAPLPAPAEN